jgi:hypothetical protein
VGERLLHGHSAALGPGHNVVQSYFFIEKKSPLIFLRHSRDPTAFQDNQMSSREINYSSNHHHHACPSGQVIRDVALTIP